MGIHNDKALARLPENFGKAYHGHPARGDQITENIPRPYARELIGITHKHDTTPKGNGIEKTIKQLHIHHRHLVYDNGTGT